MTQVSIGDLVYKRNEPARVGKILELIDDEQLHEQLARVQFGDHTQTIVIDSLEHFKPGERDMWRDLAECRVSGAGSARF